MIFKHIFFKRIIYLPLLVGCNFIDPSIIIKNETERTIFFRWDNDTVLSENPIITHYNSLPPDLKTGRYQLNLSDAVLPNSSNTPTSFEFRGWNKYFRNNKFLYIYIFDSDTLNSYSWEIIRENQKFLKRFDLTIDDIKKSNWEIIYKE